MASKGLEGFTPQLRRMLEQAGVDLAGGRPAAGSAVWGQSLAPTEAERAASPWYQLRARTGVTPVGNLTDAGNPAIQAAVSQRKQGRIDPTVLELLDQVNRSRQIEQQRGGPDTRPKPNLLLRGLDYLGRPGAAVMGAITEMSRESRKSTSTLEGFDPDVYKGALRGLKRGFTAQERYHGSRALDEFDVPGTGNRAVRAVAGFGADMVTDPLSYLTFGVGKAAPAPAAAAKEATEAGAAKAAAAGARRPADDLARVLSGPRSRVPMTPRQRNVRMQQAVQAIDVAAADVGRTAGRQAAAGGAPPAAIAAVRQQAAETTARELTELAQANMAQQIRRSLTVSAAGYRLASVPIPAGVTAAARAVASAPLAERALATFSRTFDTGSRFDRVLTAAKARSAGLAERRIELARDDLTTQFRGTNKAQRIAAMEALATGTPGFGAGIAKTAAGGDVADVIKDAFERVGGYIDWDKSGSAILTIEDINRFLPRKFQFDKTALPKGAGALSPADRMAALVQRNGDYLRTADPAQYLYALHIGLEKAIARDQLARAVAVFGVPASGTRTWSRAGQELATRHGYAPIKAGGRDKDVGAAYRRHFDGLVFDPEVRKGVTRLLAVADDVATRGEVMRVYDRSLAGLKKLLTLPNPSFHLRNSFGDVFLGYLDDVSGPRGVRSYEQASRTMLALRNLGKQPNLRAVLDGAVDPATGQAPDPIKALAAAVSAGRRAPGPGARVMKVPRTGWADAPGDWLTAEQLWAAYQHAGLKRGFVAADLEQQLSTRSVRPIGAPTDVLTDLSAAREDYFRLAHFIDRIKRSKASSFTEAAEDAAHYVRKFHFDYHDVTPTEQAIFARLFPFYKFQRFAAPLMVQMFMARPGKILNTQRGLYGVSDAAGYERDDTGLPAADQVLPEYFRDAAMFPLFESARGNTVWANPGLPGTAIPATTLGMAGDSPGEVAKGIGQNLVGSVNPLVQAPFELATGRRVFGGGDIPVGPLPEYLAGKTPITNLAFVGSGKDDADTRWSSWATGLGLSENTPSRQRGALMDELKKISANRKADGYVVPRTGRGRPSRPGR